MTKREGPTMIYHSTLLARPGWTETTIRKFAGGPDQFVPNPHYKSGPSAQLYDLARIEKIEATFDFQYSRDRVERLRTRAKKAAKKTVATKRTEILDWANKVPMKIERRDLVTVINLAYANHAWQAEEKGRDELDYNHVSDDFKQRVAVNFLRHQQSRYEDLLRATYGRVGVVEAYPILKRRVLDEIAKTYPELKRECERQAAAL